MMMHLVYATIADAKSSNAALMPIPAMHSDSRGLLYAIDCTNALRKFISGVEIKYYCWRARG